MSNIQNHPQAGANPAPIKAQFNFAKTPDMAAVRTAERAFRDENVVRPAVSPMPIKLA